MEGRAYKERYRLCYLLKFIREGSIRVIESGWRPRLLVKISFVLPIDINPGVARLFTKAWCREPQVLRVYSL